MKCNAKSKRTGKQCTKEAIQGKTKCRYHGGLTPSGMASPHWRTGRHSKYLPTALLSKYQESQQDPDLLNLRDEISLTDTRLKQLLEKLPEGGASHSWTDLSKAWQEFVIAQRQNNQSAAEAALRKLNEIITEGADEAQVWYAIEGTIENRRKLTASEAKRLTDMQQTVTAEKALSFAYRLLDIVSRNTKAIILDVPTQRKLLTVVSDEIRAIVTIPDRANVDDGG